MSTEHENPSPAVSISENAAMPIRQPMTPDKPWHKRLPDFESFDRIELKVVPRYKTSGLSGDEWRQHVEMSFYFKGKLVHSSGSSDMKNAIMRLGHVWGEAQCPIPMEVINIEETKCDQPSCEEDAVGKYLIKRETSDHGDYIDPTTVYGRKYRQFCAKHARRGDCSREDSDDNYEPMDGLNPESSTNTEESRSVVMRAEDTTLHGLVAGIIQATEPKS